MKNNVYTIISYNNFELKLLLFSYLNEKPFLLFEELIDKVNINEITSDVQKDAIIKKIRVVVGEAERNLKIKINNVIVTLDPQSYYFNRKNFTFELPEDFVVGKQDVAKTYEHIMDNDTAHEKYMFTYFDIEHFYDNDNQPITNPINKQLNAIVIKGESVYVDTETYYNLESIISKARLKIDYYRVGGYLLKNETNLEPDMAIMEVETETINFIINHEGKTRQLSIDWGFKSIMESLYHGLLEVYDPELCEQIVLFFMDYMPLKPYDVNIELAEGVKLNELIEQVRAMFAEYFKHIIEEIRLDGIQLKEIKVIIHEYESTELIKLLSDNLRVNISKLEYKKYKNATPENIKAYLAIQNVAQLEKITK